MLLSESSWRYDVLPAGGETPTCRYRGRDRSERNRFMTSGEEQRFVSLRRHAFHGRFAMDAIDTSALSTEWISAPHSSTHEERVLQLGRLSRRVVAGTRSGQRRRAGRRGRRKSYSRLARPRRRSERGRRGGRGSRPTAGGYGWHPRRGEESTAPQVVGFVRPRVDERERAGVGGRRVESISCKSNSPSC